MFSMVSVMFIKLQMVNAAFYYEDASATNNCSFSWKSGIYWSRSEQSFEHSAKQTLLRDALTSKHTMLVCHMNLGIFCSF